MKTRGPLLLLAALAVLAGGCAKPALHRCESVYAPMQHYRYDDAGERFLDGVTPNWVTVCRHPPYSALLRRAWGRHK